MTPEQAQALVRGELSKRARTSHAALLVAAVGLGSAVASVWITEPVLPLRTHLSFLFLVLIALGWAGHAAWVLTHSAVLLVPHQVRAAKLALLCSLLFLAGCSSAWLMSGTRSAAVAAGTGLVMAAIAALNLRHATVRHTSLMRRRAELIRERRPL